MDFNKDTEKKTKHTYVGIYYKNGDLAETVTYLDKDSVTLLITGTTRDQRFIALASVMDTVDIFNVDHVNNFTIAEHDEDDEEE